MGKHNVFASPLAMPGRICFSTLGTRRAWFIFERMEMVLILIVVGGCLFLALRSSYRRSQNLRDYYKRDDQHKED